jgi:hypothetical protein
MGVRFQDSSDTKADFTALAVNKVIGEVIQSCTAGDAVKDRCHIGAIGYGTDAKLLFIDSASELAKNDNIITVPKRLPDGAGGMIEIEHKMRLFVPSVANGSTEMGKGFKLAIDGVQKFNTHFPNSFPPIVINITDGEPNDFDHAEREAGRLTSLSTSDGSVILMNAFVSDSKGVEIQLPANDDAFANNSFAKFLYRLSSKLPEQLVAEARNCGFDAEVGSRGFVYNASPDSLVRFLRFGTAMDTAIERA